MNPLYKIYCRIFQIGLRIALPVLPYRNPKIVDRISDVPLIVKKSNLKKPLIITDGNLSKLGAAEGLKRYFKKESIGWYASSDLEDTRNPAKLSFRLDS